MDKLSKCCNAPIDNMCCDECQGTGVDQDFAMVDCPYCMGRGFYKNHFECTDCDNEVNASD